MRTPHWLDPTASIARPCRIIFFDTETKQVTLPDGRDRHDLYLGVATFCRKDRGWLENPYRSFEFTSPDDLWEQVDRWVSSKTTVYLVAHNMVYDLAVSGAFERLQLLGWELTTFYSKGMVSLFRWRKDGKKIVGIDDTNFFEGTLEKWGDVVGLPKLQVDFRTVSDVDLWERCRRDVGIMVRLWRLWLTFLDDNDCGAFKPTVGSTAFNTWRYRFLHNRMFIHSNEAALGLEREAYHGGRTEAFWTGRRDDGPFYYLDVNNMYGHVLSSNPYPSVLYGQSDHGDPYRLAYKLSKYSVIARVIVNVDEPLLPYEVGGFTAYPLGMFEATLTTPELKYAIDRSWLVDVLSLAWYRQEALFADYISFFHRLRHRYQAEGNVGFAKICKLLNNSLYGKFGQRGLKQELIGKCDPHMTGRETIYDEPSGMYYDQVYLAGRVYKEWNEGESYNSFPAIAAHVTAYARLELWKLLKQVPAGHAFYADTDSLIVDEIGYKSLASHLDPVRLGCLKVERTSPWLEVNCPKDYAMDGRSRMKGVSSKATLTPDGGYSQTQWTRLNGLIRQGLDKGYTTSPVVKHLTRAIHSGTVSPEGWVEPFHLEPLPAQVPVSVSSRSLQPR